MMKNICPLGVILNDDLKLSPFLNTLNRITLKPTILLVYLLFTALINAEEMQSDTMNKPVLEVFVRDTCPHCSEAKKYLPSLAKHYPHVQIVVRSIDQDTAAREVLMARSKKAGIWPPGVPTFIFSGRMHVGFKSVEQTGPELMALINEELASKADVSTKTSQNGFESQVLGNISIDRIGLPLFTFTIGLLDGFNPCAMWVLLFLLSLLVHLHNRKKMLVIAGTFVLVSGIVYYALIAAWLNLFIFIGISSILMQILGAVALLLASINIKEAFIQQDKFSLAIPASAKPSLYSRMRTIINANSLGVSVLGVIVLAIVVNFIELLCTSGFPALYVAILTQQELSTSMYYGYIGLYILGYILDDSIIVTIAVIALSSKKLSSGTGQKLKLISGSVMFMLGLVMLFRPSWLS